MKLFVGGTSANPPHIIHQEILAAVQRRAAEGNMVLWIIAGTRSDKILASARHRIAMTRCMIPGEWTLVTPTRFQVNGGAIHVEIGDADGENTPTIRWLERLHNEYPRAEIVFFTGSDVLEGRERYGGNCEVAARWVEGEKLLADWHWLVFPRGSAWQPNVSTEMPRACIIGDALPGTSSSDIRSRIAKDEEWQHLVPSGVARYIMEHQLYEKAATSALPPHHYRAAETEHP